MSYDVLLGHKFVTQPGIIIILNNTVNIKFNKAVSKILHIDVIERRNVLDNVWEHLDYTLYYEDREKLINLSTIMSDHEACHIDNFKIALVENSILFYYTDTCRDINVAK